VVVVQDPPEQVIPLNVPLPISYLPVL